MKIKSSAIQELCSELAAANHESLEMHMNRKLMTFLNYIVRVLDRKPARRRR